LKIQTQKTQKSSIQIETLLENETKEILQSFLFDKKVSIEKLKNDLLLNLRLMEGKRSFIFQVIIIKARIIIYWEAWKQKKSHSILFVMRNKTLKKGIKV